MVPAPQQVLDLAPSAPCRGMPLPSSGSTPRPAHRRRKRPGGTSQAPRPGRPHRSHQAPPGRPPQGVDDQVDDHLASAPTPSRRTTPTTGRGPRRPGPTPRSRPGAGPGRRRAPSMPGRQRLHQSSRQAGLGRGPDLVGGVRTDQGLEDGPGSVPVDPGHQGLDHLRQSLVLRGVLIVHPLGGHGGDVEVGLAPEVAGDECGVDAGPLADLPDGGALEARLAEQLLGRLEQGLATGGRVPRPGRLGRSAAPSGSVAVTASRLIGQGQLLLGQHQAGPGQLGLLFHDQVLAGPVPHRAPTGRRVAAVGPGST